jgi:RNA polymerase sigma-B factor
MSTVALSSPSLLSRRAVPRHGGVAAPHSLATDSIEALVRTHLPLARKLAYRYADRGEPIDDLVQVANLGLVNAARRYEPGRGIRFATYAIPVITGELKRHFRDHVWPLHVARDEKERAVLVNTAIRNELERTGTVPSSADLARRLKLTEEEIGEARDTWSALRPESLDAPAAGQHDPAAPLLADLIGQVDDRYDCVDSRLTRMVAMRQLSTLERRVLHMRYVEDRTQSDIAIRLGLTQGGVSRMLIQMRKHLELAPHRRRRRTRR